MDTETVIIRFIPRLDIVFEIMYLTVGHLIVRLSCVESHPTDIKNWIANWEPCSREATSNLVLRLYNFSLK